MIHVDEGFVVGAFQINSVGVKQLIKRVQMGKISVNLGSFLSEPTTATCVTVLECGISSIAFYLLLVWTRLRSFYIRLPFAYLYLQYSLHQ